MIPRHQATLQSLVNAERSKPWADESIGTTARLLAETAERFLLTATFWLAKRPSEWE